MNNTTNTLTAFQTRPPYYIKGFEPLGAYRQFIFWPHRFLASWPSVWGCYSAVRLFLGPDMNRHVLSDSPIKIILQDSGPSCKEANWSLLFSRSECLQNFLSTKLSWEQCRGLCLVGKYMYWAFSWFSSGLGWLFHVAWRCNFLSW